MKIIGKIKARLGPLGWGSLLVFVLFRSNDLAGILYRYIAGRALSHEEFGALGAVFSFCTISIVPMLAVMQVATKSISRVSAENDTARLSGLIRDILVWAAAFTVILAAGLWFCRYPVLERLKLGEEYLPVIAFLVVAGLWAMVLLGIFQGLRSFLSLGMQNVASAAVLLVCAVLFVLKNHLGLAGALWAKLVSLCVLVMTGLLFLLPLVLKKSSSYGDEKRIMRNMIWPILVYWLSIGLMQNLDRLFMRNFAVQLSGQYEAVATIGGIPLYFIGAAVFVIFPLVAFEHAAGNDVARYLKQGLLLAIVCTMCSAVIFGAAAKPLLCLWNPEFSGSSNFVGLLALSSGMHGTVQMVANVELARHRYGFIWILAVPAVLMAAVLYSCKHMMSIPLVVWTLVIMNGLTLLLLVFYAVVYERLKKGSAGN